MLVVVAVCIAHSCVVALIKSSPLPALYMYNIYTYGCVTGVASLSVNYGMCLVFFPSVHYRICSCILSECELWDMPCILPQVHIMGYAAVSSLSVLQGMCRHTLME